MALKSPPFELLQSVDLRPLTRKTALLLALASLKRMGDLHALSVSPSCLKFGPNNSKIILKPRHGYIPKVLLTPFRAQVITLSALLPSEQDQGLNLLFPVRALRIYIEHSAPFRQSEQLCMLWRPHQRVSGHKAETIQMDNWRYYARIFFMGVRAATKGIVSSWAWSSGAFIAEMCAVAGWASPYTFVRFYNLEIPALQARVLSA